MLYFPLITQFSNQYHLSTFQQVHVIRITFVLGIVWQTNTALVFLVGTWYATYRRLRSTDGQNAQRQEHESGRMPDIIAVNNYKLQLSQLWRDSNCIYTNRQQWQRHTRLEVLVLSFSFLPAAVGGSGFTFVRYNAYKSAEHAAIIFWLNATQASN